MSEYIDKLCKDKEIQSWFFDADIDALIRANSDEPKTGVHMNIKDIHSNGYYRLHNELVPIRNVVLSAYPSDMLTISDDQRSTILKRIFYYCEFSNCQKLHMLIGTGIKLCAPLSLSHGWHCKEVPSDGDCLYSCIAHALNNHCSTTNVRVAQHPTTLYNTETKSRINNNGQ